MITLFHNPRCSKSREALALLEARGVEFRIHRYLDEPLDAQALHELAARLDDPSALLRTNEAEWKALDEDATDLDSVIAAIAATPKLMQRPIADRGDRAIVGRPPEAILALLD
ncbi:arsenate reductase family protein [Halomonas salifodinae]|uniref:arsenate reductase family protein n=1 Tax=Halomonas salifodinae TaxID=438745 RepID=UPI0033A6E985